MEQTTLLKLAKGNPVDLDKVAQVEKQLSELEAAGVLRRRPLIEVPMLSNPAAALRASAFANQVEST